MPRAMRVVLLFVSGLLPGYALGADLPGRFTLGRYIPGDVWFYLHRAHNPELAWLDKEWDEVFAAFRETGIQRDIVLLAASAVGGGDLAAAGGTAGRWTELLAGVRWGDMCSEELAVAERLPAEKLASTRGTSGEPFMPEYIVLMRGKADGAEANVQGLVAICREIASLSSRIQVGEQTVNGVPVWSLVGQPPDSTGFGFGVHVFRKGDVIGVTVGLQPYKDVISLMTGKSARPSIVATARFQKALAEVKAPEDSVIFADVKQVFRGVELVTGLAEKNGRSAGAERDSKVAGMLRGLMNLCDVFDYSITSVETHGRRRYTHTLVRIQEEKRESGIVRALVARKPFERFDQFVPVDATGYHLNTLFDLEYLYKVVTDLVREGVPAGPEYLAAWEALLSSAGFDLQRDLFSWWSGELAFVSLPAAPGSPMGGSDWMLAVRVKDTELARQKVNAAIDFVNEKLQAHAQALIITPAPVSAEGFRQITHPLAMMFARPVIGVKDGWLMIGGTPAAVDKCLAVAAGKAPSILQNERFKSEGLIPREQVQSASFRDTSRLGEEVTKVASVAGVFVGGLVAAESQDDPELGKAMQVIRGLLAAGRKLGPVLQKIDFYSSQSSIGTYDGNVTLRTEMVTTYKPLTPEEGQAAGAK